MILHGAAMGSKADLGNASPRMLWVIVLGILLQAWWLWIYVLDRRFNSIYLVVLALWVFPLLALLARRWSNQRPGLIRIYVSPRGCLLLDHPSEPAAIGMAWSLVVPIFGLIGLAWVIVATRGVTRVLLAATITAALLAQGYVKWRRIKRPTTPIHSLKPAQALAIAGHQWNGEEDLKCKPLREGFLRLTIRQEVRWYEFQQDFVDAEIACDGEKCGRIDALIWSWIRESKRRRGS